jgi:hypothetical protein
MRYLVTARVKRGKENDLLRAIQAQTLGRGSVAGDEYLRNMTDARIGGDGSIRWVEVCFCATPLDEGAGCASPVQVPRREWGGSVGVW